MQKSSALWVLILAIGLGACSNVKEKLGLDRSAPDEFRVVSRAPLTLPPDFGLRPPAPGSTDTGRAPQQQARESLLGASAVKSTAPASNDEAKLLEMTGASTSDPNIRATINREEAQIAESNKTLLDRIRTYEPPATVVDATKEKERLEKNKQDGVPANTGDVPMIQPKQKGLFER